MRLMWGNLRVMNKWRKEEKKKEGRTDGGWVFYPTDRQCPSLGSLTLTPSFFKAWTSLILHKIRIDM